MISLLQAIDNDYQAVLDFTVESYRRAVDAVREAGSRAFPPDADTFEASLRSLREVLTGEPPREELRSATARLETDLQKWSTHAAGFYQEKTDELRDILLIIANATQELAARDKRYEQQLHGVTHELRVASELDDLSALKRSVAAVAAQITECVRRMNQDGQDTAAGLKGKLATYESRLEQAERLANIDPLTGLANRRVADLQLARRVAEGQPFSVIYFDLNGFKQINDTLGHAAGDELLKQVAAELHGFRVTDLVARWGGDEFLILAGGTPGNSDQYVSRIDHWIGGNYTLPTPTGPQKVAISAATGVADWRPGETAADIFSRADAAMYLRKATQKQLSRER